MANSGFKTQLKPRGTKNGKYCGIVLVELKLLQVVCNRTMVLKPKGEKINLQRRAKSAAKGLKLCYN